MQQQALLNELLDAQPPARDDLQITLGINTTILKQLRERNQHEQTQIESPQI